MEEIYQITAALRYLSFGKHVAVLTDARFSGVSTGACIGHVSPEALAGGPIGKLRDGDLIRIVDRPRSARRVARPGRCRRRRIRRRKKARACSPAGRRTHSSRPIPTCPTTRGSGRPSDVGGGAWGGCVYDTDAIISALARASAHKRRCWRRRRSGLIDGLFLVTRL